jgi:hypothetical protein
MTENNQAGDDLPDTSGSWPPPVHGCEPIIVQKREGTHPFLSFLFYFLITPVPYAYGCILICGLVSLFLPMSFMYSIGGAVLLWIIAVMPMMICCRIAWRDPKSRKMMWGVIPGMMLGSLLYVQLLCLSLYHTHYHH